MVRPEDYAAVAKAITTDLSALAPPTPSYFAASPPLSSVLTPWLQRHRGLQGRATRTSPSPRPSRWPTTCSQAIGADNLTPFSLQADIMNGVDPSPRTSPLEDSLFTEHKVNVFVYNEQVVDSLTESFRARRKRRASRSSASTRRCRHPGYDYQSWMLAEVDALQRAVADKVSTEHL